MRKISLFENALEQIKKTEEKLIEASEDSAVRLTLAASSYSEVDLPEGFEEAYYSPWMCSKKEGGIKHCLLFHLKSKNLRASEVLIFPGALTKDPLGKVCTYSQLLSLLKVKNLSEVEAKLLLQARLKGLKVEKIGYFVKPKISIAEVKRAHHARRRLKNRPKALLRLVETKESCSVFRRLLLGSAADSPLTRHELQTAIAMQRSKSCQCLAFPWTRKETVVLTALLGLFSENLKKSYSPMLFVFENQDQVYAFKEKYLFLSDYILLPEEFPSVLHDLQMKVSKVSRSEISDRLLKNWTRFKKRQENYYLMQQDVTKFERILMTLFEETTKLRESIQPVTEYTQEVFEIAKNFKDLYHEYLKEDFDSMTVSKMLKRLSLRKREKALEKAIYHLPISGGTPREKAIRCFEIAQNYVDSKEKLKKLRALEKKYHLLLKEYEELKKRLYTGKEDFLKALEDNYYDFSKLNFIDLRRYAELSLRLARGEAAFKKLVIDEMKLYVSEFERLEDSPLKSRSRYFFSILFKYFPILVGTPNTLEDLLDLLPSDFFITAAFSDSISNLLKAAEKSKHFFLISSYTAPVYLKTLYLYDQFPENLLLGKLSVFREEDFPIQASDLYCKKDSLVAALSGDFSKAQERLLRGLLEQNLTNPRICRLEDDSPESLQKLKEAASTFSKELILLLDLRKSCFEDLHLLLRKEAEILDLTVHPVNVDEDYIELPSLEEAQAVVLRALCESESLQFFSTRVSKYFLEQLLEGLLEHSSKVRLICKRPTNLKVLEPLEKANIEIFFSDVKENILKTPSFVLKTEFSLFDNLSTKGTSLSFLKNLQPKAYLKRL